MYWFLIIAGVVVFMVVSIIASMGGIGTTDHSRDRNVGNNFIDWMM